ncbi:MAG: AmmeMemoRadiSam system radical SAM enzyme [Candidatus Omnitrophica bacterium]|nr:AmmeMemoRadiSam system radical SAM enzyme [Candidatus Omnitrophota bacterium]
MKEASYYEKTGAVKKVRCHLCPNECLIADGKAGSCRVRINRKGVLYSEIYGRVSSIALDPIEKKPLYHYHPGEMILSLGTKRCNLRCDFCQNWQISQSDPPLKNLTSEDAVSKAKEAGSFALCYTYNEPFIWYEYVLDTARLAKEEGLDNVLVTNGYINQAPLEEILPFIDAMNIDIKSMEEDFYEKICRGRLKPVLDTAKRAARESHVEITNLIIPTLNDGDLHFQKLVNWVADNLGSHTPLHFSRYFPCYKREIPSTPIETMRRAEQIAKKRLKNVYLGNV